MTRSSLRKFFFCIAAGVLAIGIGLFICLLPPHHPSTKPGISVLSITNNPANEPSVTFSLTNPTALQMYCMIRSPQIYSGGTWSYPPPRPLRVQVVDDVVLLPHKSLRFGFELAPHQSTNFTVEIPPGTEVWRVPVSYFYPPSDRKGFRDKIRVNLKANWTLLKRGQSPRLINNWDSSTALPVYWSYSPEMNRQSSPEQQIATNRSPATID
jgi:hypothetical protein